MTSFIDVFKHLLPSGRAWRLTADKPLRRFFSGLTGTAEDARGFVDDVWGDIYPESTRELSAWERQFGLQSVGLSEQGRRDRLSAAWKALGGQSPRYIQGTLRARGFDVYVHDWWDPATVPALASDTCATPRSPLAVLRREYTGVVLFVECGEALAQCGEESAQCGNSAQPRGYPLVNKILETVPDLQPLCGEAFAQCGETIMQCGNFQGLRDIRRNYIVPRDVEKWPYFLYIGGPSFGDIAQVDPSRRDEFEALCLKICPSHLWLGILVEYL